MAIPTVTLNDGNTLPVLGLGVAGLSDAQTEASVSAALEAGYRLIDTAAAYGNEAAVGRAIESSGIAREEIVVTTKLATDDQGFQEAIRACNASLERLGLTYVDLYLIHWPAEQLGKYVDSFGALMRLKADDLVRSIGVSNFLPHHLQNVSELTFFTPAVNQIELHPRLRQTEVRKANTDLGIVTEAYSPLGVGALTDDPAVTAIAEAHGKTPAQVLIRWNLDLGNVVIPRSSNPERIAANADVFDFALSADETATLSGLDNGTRYRPDPATYTGT